LTGAWHGASWNFIIWGLWHGLFLSLERIPALALLLERMPRVLRTGYVLFVVLVGWVFFRASTLEHALAYLGRMVAPAPQADLLLGTFDLITWRSLAVMAIAFALSLPLWPKLRDDVWRIGSRDPMRWASPAYVTAVMLLSFAAMAAQENSPFLYFRF
jgi:alginate O-acetyltransferase complex protein AlgI